MATPTPQRDIQNLVQRLARRIRAQRAFDGAVTGATITAMVSLLALVLFKTGWIEESAFWAAFVTSLAAPLGLTVLGWVRKLDPVALAQRIDRSHRLHDRLSTAFAISERGPRNDFERAQIRDAIRFIDQVDLKPAAPFRRPAELLPLLALTVALVGLAVLRPPSDMHPLPEPPPIEHDAILDAATLEMEKNRLENLREELSDIDDPEVQALIDEIEALLVDVEDRNLSEKEFLDRLEKLEEKYFDTNAEKELARLSEKLKEAAEELEKEAAKDLAQDEEMKELVEALKKEDLAAASKAMEKIADKLMNKDLSDEQLERIARLMEKFADKIDPSDPALQKLIEKNRELIDKLSKQMQDKGLSDADKQRLDRAKEELDKLQKQAEKQENSESSRELKRISRMSKETSERATRETTREDAEPGKGKKEQQQQQQQQQGKGEDEKGNFKNEAGRKAEQASKAMGDKGEQQKKDAAKDMARKQLHDLKESMQRSGGQQGSGEKGEEQGEERGDAMREFLRRAKGEKEVGGEKGETADGKEGSGKQNVSGAKGQSQSDDPFAGQIDGETNMAGKGKGGRELGEETSLDSKREDVKVEGEAGKGPSRSEIIRAASEEGFATTEYKDVYVDYSSVVEEVMEKEKVPAGYRYYIKRYFQLIQPQE